MFLGRELVKCFLELGHSLGSWQPQRTLSCKVEVPRRFARSFDLLGVSYTPCKNKTAQPKRLDGIVKCGWKNPQKI